MRILPLAHIKLNGDLIGESFDYYEYDSFGNQTFNGYGTKITMSGVRENSKIPKSHELANIVNITIDGQEHVSRGLPIIFTETGLHMIDAKLLRHLYSSVSEIDSIESISSWINSIRPIFKNAKVIVIKSELGNPIAVFQGDLVHWEVMDNLPRTIYIDIDGKALYIHRATFDIIDLSLID